MYIKLCSYQQDVECELDSAVLQLFPRLLLTLCHRATLKDMIAVPCIVDRSRLSTFSYTTSYTCICQLIWLTYHFKVIDSLVQDVWVSSYKQTDWSWPPIFRNIRLQQCSCHHGMARPQVADGGTTSNMEGSCEYIEYTVSDSWQGVVLQFGGWVRG
jgi:hypothetical protein